MGTLYLVRHGQASFGAADYDQLSPLGQEQSLLLGRYFAERGIGFDAALCGTLKRHHQTWAGIAEGAGLLLAPRLWPGLNEYDAEALIRAIHPDALTTLRRQANGQDGYRQHFRQLRDGLRQWMAGTVSPQGMPSYPEFVQGVTSALAHVLANHQGQRVLLVSSGGPIATAVGQVLGLSPETSIGLNLRIRNSAVSVFEFNPKRHNLLSYNALPHLERSDREHLISYA